jgi:ferredoxin
LRAHVDPEKCQGHLRCVIFAPDVFEIDDYGNAHVEMGVVPSHLEEGTRQAAANCPERAISIDEGGGCGTT